MPRHNAQFCDYSWEHGIVFSEISFGVTNRSQTRRARKEGTGLCVFGHAWMNQTHARLKPCLQNQNEYVRTRQMRLNMAAYLVGTDSSVHHSEVTT